MKKNIEKSLYILINFLVIAGFIAFVYSNWEKTVEYICPVMQKVYTTKLVYLISVLFCLAYAAGFALCMFIKSKTEALCSAYQKRHENISAANDESSSRISALEAKIQTLETALESALKNK